ncbi:unnamed protein product [Caenorhabditis brenneri]
MIEICETEKFFSGYDNDTLHTLCSVFEEAWNMQLAISLNEINIAVFGILCNSHGYRTNAQVYFICHNSHAYVHLFPYVFTVSRNGTSRGKRLISMESNLNFCCVWYEPPELPY